MPSRVETRYGDLAGTNVAARSEYAYDMDQRLVARKVFLNGSSTASESQHLVYDGNQMTLVMDNAGNVEHRMLWGPAVDQVFADENGADDLLWMLTDNQNTVRDVVEYDAGTDTTTVANHIAYNSFGNKQSETNAALDVLSLNYTARFFDKATGLQWNLNRWYDPQVGRWLSEDPIGFLSGDENLNRYVGNYAIDSVDPWGLQDLPEGLTQEQLNEKIQLAKDNAWWYIKFGTDLASRLLSHFRDGSGTDFVLTQDDLQRIVGTSQSEAEIKVAIADFKQRLGSARLTGRDSPFAYTTRTLKITYPQPTSKWDRTDSADMFYSFHNLYFEVEFDGMAKCDGANNKWHGKITYKFHDDYRFANRDWQAIPGDNEATDYIFWLWQEFGDAAAFKVRGDYKSTGSFSVKNGIAPPPRNGGGGSGGGGYGSGGYGSGGY